MKVTRTDKVAVQTTYFPAADGLGPRIRVASTCERKPVIFLPYDATTPKESNHERAAENYIHQMGWNWEGMIVAKASDGFLFTEDTQPDGVFVPFLADSPREPAKKHEEYIRTTLSAVLDDLAHDFKLHEEHEFNKA